MAHSKQQVAGDKEKRQRLAVPTLFLARWQLRQTWRLLLVIGLGMVAAVILVCAVPLYSYIAMTAELRGFLTAAPITAGTSNADIVVQSSSSQVSGLALNMVGKQLDTELQTNLSSYLTNGGRGQFTFQMDGVPFLQPAHNAQGKIALMDQGNRLNLIGASMKDAAPHVQIVQGRLPLTNSSDLEIAISQETATGLELTLGAVLTMQLAFDDQYGQRLEAQTTNVPLRVVGIFNVKPASFWHGEDFHCEPLGPFTETCHLLVSKDTLITSLSHFATKSGLGGTSIETPPNAYWYYTLDPMRIDINNVGDVERGLGLVLGDVANKPIGPPYVEKTVSFSNAPDVLGTYSSHIAVVQIPITSLSLLVAGLTLFFVSMMTDILVERQADAIAVLRSRGASRWQIIGSLMLQSIGIGVVALIVGPLLAVVVVQVVSTNTLSAADQGALNVINTNPWPLVQVLAEYALLTVGIAIVAMLIAIGSATQMGILSARREYARSTYRPIWQRLSLDVVAAIIALTGYAFSAYEASPGVIDARTRVLVLPPLTLAGVVFLLLGLSLLFLRVFPLILRLCSWFATRGRSATPMLALAQMARAPRQSIRMTMLLAFAIAFALFTLIFNASQAQRILDVTNYEVGADFSGKIPGSATVAQSSTYSRLSGVLSATVGYTSQPRSGENGLNLSVQFMAVDAGTFAQTMIWPEGNSAQSLDALMRQLIDQRGKVVQSSVVPAIVDTTAWNTLHLAPGTTFTLSDTNGTVTCVAIAVVQRIPTINDSLLASGTGDYFAFGGILVDYKSYSTALAAAANTMPPTTDVWLRTRSDAASLSNVRAALKNGSYQLDMLNDRRAIISNLRNDPLYLDLVGVLILGAATAMLLALLGNLIASWLSVRSRLTSFAVLRALGTGSSQIAGVIAWEQSIIYGTALVLGVVFGAMLSLLALPTLIFTNVAISGFNSDIASGEYYILQSVPPVQIIVPASLGIAFVLIVAICIVALGMMVRIAARPSISQALRLNED